MGEEADVPADWDTDINTTQIIELLFGEFNDKSDFNL